MYVDHKKHQREAQKTKYTYHKVNVAQEKNQKNKKEERTSKQQKKKKIDTPKKKYHTKNVNNARQKPQQETKRKKDDHQKTKDPNIKKLDKKSSTQKNKIYHVDFYILKDIQPSLI